MEIVTPRKRSHLLAMAPLGFIFGFINTAMPILLAAQNVPVHIIANVSVIAFLPTSLAFLICPILDVRFTRRFYIVVCAIVCALSLTASIFEYQHIVLFTTLITFCCTSAVLYGNALAGWTVDALPSSDFGWLGSCTNIANLGAAGAFGSFSIHMVRALPLPLAAALLGVIVVLPLILLVSFPKPIPPQRKAAETFRNLFRDLYRLLGQRACLLGLAAFMLPTSCFALANLVSGLGKDFNAPESYVANMTGIGVAIACSIGTLIGAPLCNRFFRGHVYLIIGMGGAICSIGMMLAPRTLTSFTVYLIAYNLLQGIVYTAFTAFGLDLTGKNNPLAATQLAIFAASANLPILYMSYFEGHAHDRFGLNAMFAVDAAGSIAAGTLLLFLFRRFQLGKGPLTQPESVIAAS